MVVDKGLEGKSESEGDLEAQEIHGSDSALFDSFHLLSLSHDEIAKKTEAQLEQEAGANLDFLPLLRQKLFLETKAGDKKPESINLPTVSSLHQNFGSKIPTFEYDDSLTPSIADRLSREWKSLKQLGSFWYALFDLEKACWGLALQFVPGLAIIGGLVTIRILFEEVKGKQGAYVIIIVGLIMFIGFIIMNYLKFKFMRKIGPAGLRLRFHCLLVEKLLQIQRDIGIGLPAGPVCNILQESFRDVVDIWRLFFSIVQHGFICVTTLVYISVTIWLFGGPSLIPAVFIFSLLALLFLSFLFVLRRSSRHALCKQERDWRLLYLSAATHLIIKHQPKKIVQGQDLSHENDNVNTDCADFAAKVDQRFVPAASAYATRSAQKFFFKYATLTAGRIVVGSIPFDVLFFIGFHTLHEVEATGEYTHNAASYLALFAASVKLSSSLNVLLMDAVKGTEKLASLAQVSEILHYHPPRSDSQVAY